MMLGVRKVVQKQDFTCLPQRTKPRRRRSLAPAMSMGSSAPYGGGSCREDQGRRAGNRAGVGQYCGNSGTNVVVQVALLVRERDD